MANNGEQKNPNGGKQKSNVDNLLKDDTASFDPKTGIMEAEGYRYNVNWEPWDEDGEGFTSRGGTEVSTEDVAPKKNNVLMCQNCGEDYSDTYRRCPFCDERPNRFKAKRGGAGEYQGAGMAPKHFAGFAISTVLIVSAGFIVVQEVLPFIVGQSQTEVTEGGSSTTTPNVTPTEDDPTQPPENMGGGDAPAMDSTVDEAPVVDEPAVEETPVVDVPPVEETPVVDEPVVEAPTENVLPDLSGPSISLSAEDVSLKADESFTLSTSVSGSVTWASSHPEYATVSSSGVVSNLNTSGSTKTVEIYGTVDGATGTCIVRLASGTASSSSSSSGESSATGLGTGKANIANAGSGVRIRSMPSTEGSVLATGSNGSDIEVLSEAGNGWYEIQFTGSNGKEVGYIMGDFIEMKS